MVAGDGVQELGSHLRVEVARAFLDHPEPEVDVAEQPSLGGLAEGGAACELARAADVVQDRRGEEEVGAEARVELGRLPTERRHAHGVLEQAAGVAVVTVGAGGGERAHAAAELAIAEERVHEAREIRVGDLAGEEVEEAVELVRIPPERRRQGGRVGLGSGLERADLNLEASAIALDATEHAHGVALGEARLQEVDVGPHAGLDASARIRELEREVGRSRTRAAAFLAHDRVDTLDGAILLELGDRGHGSSLRRKPALVRSRVMADAKPFRAVRYSGAAGALADLVAPPYDAVSDEERAVLYTRSPYNVVHLTLPTSVESAAHLYRTWLEEGVLERDGDASAWLLVEDFVGPDGIARERRGVVISIAALPYGDGSVLPHERTHPPILANRLALLRATRVQPEPILLLLEGSLDLPSPRRPADLEVPGSRLWKLPDFDVRPLEDRALLIADGHHRYESAVALGRELRSGRARVPAVVVASDDPGLRVFPTHRVFAGRPDLVGLREGEMMAGLEEALSALAAEPPSRSAAVAYRRGRVELVHGRECELDVELVDRHGLAGISYTPRASEATQAVDAGVADVAYLLREPRVEDVFAVARRGELMPPKSTYFFPKPLAGLLFHEVEE